jgi:hypothetical protein
VIRAKTKIYLDSFFFAKGVVGYLIDFANEYLRLLGFDNFSKIAEREEIFKRAMKHFRDNEILTAHFS